MNTDVFLQPMTPNHPEWEEFMDRLSGEEGCNFTEEGWTCYGGHDKRFATAILQSMQGVDVEASLLYFEDHGGHCDCEIVFNVDL